VAVTPVMELLLLLVTGATAGWAAGRVMRGRGFGFVVNVLLGVAGGVLGSQLADGVGLVRDGWLAELLTATAGAVLLLVLADLLRRLIRGSGRRPES
jgi:uncharacterized membrane protein YeaQ/YmgE (transglycosylase-associated protein family)